MDLLLDLAAAPGRSLRRRAEHALREAVRSGRLAPGTRLPSTRALAAQLGVSRGVVVDAYAQLAAEGYLVTRRGGGTRVADHPAVAGPAADAVLDRWSMRPPGQDDGARRGPGGAGTGPGGAGRGRGGAPPIRHDLRPALPALDDAPGTVAAGTVVGG